MGLVRSWPHLFALEGRHVPVKCIKGVAGDFENCLGLLIAHVLKRIQNALKSIKQLLFSFIIAAQVASYIDLIAIVLYQNGCATCFVYRNFIVHVGLLSLNGAGWYNQGKGGILLTELSKIARKALKLVQKGKWRTVNPNLINVLSEAGYIEFDLEDTDVENILARTFRITDAGQAYLEAYQMKKREKWSDRLIGFIMGLLTTLIANFIWETLIG